MKTYGILKFAVDEGLTGSYFTGTVLAQLRIVKKQSDPNLDTIYATKILKNETSNLPNNYPKFKKTFFKIKDGFRIVKWAWYNRRDIRISPYYTFLDIPKKQICEFESDDDALLWYEMVKDNLD